MISSPHPLLVWVLVQNTRLPFGAYTTWSPARIEPLQVPQRPLYFALM